ncbi:MAG: hypothetical protein U1E12_19560 [Hydrogenophaga sp.]|uniref:hypothetical protein n=1 Tax=Hydrogenophaga sp. TaxID=1904254 RepID=UPI002AB8BF1D|nr:hypothetical protein [Hydrogenophaga sp.]MDZ4103871.1 hypothetical protein [Hydrogenophaga sp.]
MAIFAAGSLGRFEAGRQSDLDVFVLAEHRDTMKGSASPISHLDEIRLFAKLIEINSSLNLPEFSGDGRFLKAHSLERIISSTGDAHDDIENLFTTRMLLLLESQAIWNGDLRANAIKNVLSNYFKDGKGKADFRPLFLLNDILRYWRTLCLNYERDRVSSSKWWKTNLNLKFSRKLTIFSTVMLIVTEEAQTIDDFTRIADLVPLERLALAFDKLGDDSLLNRFGVFLDDYESFLAAKSFNEVANPTVEQKQSFKSKAESFGGLIYDAIMSEKIDPRLRRFALI